MGTADVAALVTRPDLPACFERWRLDLAPGTEHAVDRAQWSGALVLVEHGTVEVVCRAGGRRTFTTGDLLALGALPLRALRARGPEPVRLVAVRRRGDANGLSAPPMSLTDGDAPATSTRRTDRGP